MSSASHTSEATYSSQLEELPMELIAEIVAATRLDPLDIAKLCQACKSLNGCIDKTFIWSEVFSQFFDEMPSKERALYISKSALDVMRANAKTNGQMFSYSLGRIDTMAVPDAKSAVSRKKFEYGISQLIDRSFANNEKQSKNLGLLERCLRNPDNHSIVLQNYHEINPETSEVLVWPIAPWLIGCLHLLFDSTIDYGESAAYMNDMAGIQQEAYTLVTTLFDGSGHWFTRELQREGLKKLLSIIQILRAQLVLAGPTHELCRSFRSLDAGRRASAWAERYENTSDVPPRTLRRYWKGTSSSITSRARAALMDVVENPTSSNLQARYLEHVQETAGDDSSPDLFENLHLEFPNAISWTLQQDMIAPSGFADTESLWSDNTEIATPVNSIRPLYGRMRSHGSVHLLKGHLAPINLIKAGGLELEGAMRIMFITRVMEEEEREETAEEGVLYRQADEWTDVVDGAHVYEGLVTPGSRIVVGQWRRVKWGNHAFDNGVQRHLDPHRSACGPFMFWNVFDESDADGQAMINEIVNGPAEDQ